MASVPLRILSDVHFGDRSSRVRRLEQLRPLTEGVSSLLLNGDTLDTRPGPQPAYTAACRDEVTAFFRSVGMPIRFLTGNHDPDFSAEHSAELAGGAVFVTHGDIAFQDIVPWARDAPLIRGRLREHLQALPRGGSLERQLDVFRRVAQTIPQRHQSERRAGRYLGRLLADIFWPPWRAPRVVMAWQIYPGRVRALTRLHRPQARFTLVGHTHWPGVWRSRDGTVVNTGSFCRPFGALAVDLSEDELVVRAVERRGDEFRAGPAVARFALGG